jgi:hypothetical protein
LAQSVGQPCGFTSCCAAQASSSSRCATSSYPDHSPFRAWGAVAVSFQKKSNRIAQQCWYKVDERWCKAQCDRACYAPATPSSPARPATPRRPRRPRRPRCRTCWAGSPSCFFRTILLSFRSRTLGAGQALLLFTTHQELRACKVIVQSVGWPIRAQLLLS